MPGKPDRTRRTCWAAILLFMGIAGRLAAQKPKVQPAGQIDGRISRIRDALSKVDMNFKSTAETTFTIDSDDLKITIKAGDPIFYEGKSFQNGAPQTGLYGPVRVSDKFYGVERVLHYVLLRRGVPYGGVQLQERITVLFENMLHKPFRPRVFESKPFVIGKEGTFQDRQVMGHFDVPWPQSSLQVLKQDLVIDSELVATVYIVRTTKEILLVGYSVPPLIPDLSF